MSNAFGEFRKGFLILIALVWFVNGLYCKVLGMVPRHQEIVARLLGDAFAYELTHLIGWGEITLGIVILTGIQRRLVGYLQIGLVFLMNIIELVWARDLLLWHGRAIKLGRGVVLGMSRPRGLHDVWRGGCL